MAQWKCKEAKNSYEKRNKEAFKEATNQLVEESNTEPVKEMLACLNEKHMLRGDGENKRIFDAILPVAQHVERVQDEDKQVRLL